MQAIKLALILSAALPLAAQAKQPARQTAGLPQFIRSINRDAPIKSGPITIRRATAQGSNILIDAAIDSQLLPLPPNARPPSKPCKSWPKPPGAVIPNSPPSTQPAASPYATPSAANPPSSTSTSPPAAAPKSKTAKAPPSKKRKAKSPPSSSSSPA